MEDLDENGEEPPDGELPGGGNMSQSSPWWSRPDTFPRKNATIPRYGFSSPGKTVTPIAFSGNTLQVDISSLWIVIFQALMSVGVIAQQSFWKCCVAPRLIICAAVSSTGSGEWSPIMGNYVMEVLTSLGEQYR